LGKAGFSPRKGLDFGFLGLEKGNYHGIRVIGTGAGKTENLIWF